MSVNLIASDFEGGEPKSEKQSILFHLITSARDGDFGQVNDLLGRVDNINGCNQKGFSPLHAAVYSGNKNIIQSLIDNGANVNIQSRTGVTPLHIAVQENLPDVVQLLMLSGADKYLKDENGLTAIGIARREQLKSVSTILSDESSKKIRLPPLHSAAKRNDHMGAFSLLTDKEKRPNVNETNQIGLTALHMAAQYGSTEVARLLLANGAHVGFCTKSGITPLHVASKWGKHGVAALLINHNANINCLTNDLLTPLHCSARSGHVRVLDLLLRAHADPTSKTRSGLTPLHMAAQGDHDEVANLLLLSGAPIDDLTFDQLTPLHVSAHCGSANVAELLLRSKCLVDPHAMNGFTPLHVACRKNRIRVVELLIQYGANVNAFTDSGLTPLHIAILLDHTSIVGFLLDHKADPNIRCKTGKEETPLHLASATNSVEVVRELLVAGADMTVKNKTMKTPLHTACEYGNFEVAKVLLLKQLPYSPSSPRAPSSPLSSLVNEKAAEDYTPLHYACNSGKEELVALLLDHGADVDAATKRGFNSVHLAAKNGHLSILERLLTRSPESLNTKGTNKLTPLHIATHYRHNHVVRYLVRLGANLDAQAKNGYTPLHIAAKRDNLDAAEVLVENKAKINLLSKNGFSPLHLSALEGHHAMTSYLLRSGADPNLKGLDGMTPLHVAVQEDWMPIVELFLETDSVDIDAQTDSGFTPLHLSSHYGFLNASKILLRKGSSINIKNKHGSTPLHLAVQEGHLHVIEILTDDDRIDMNAVNEQLYNPMMMAKKFGFTNIEKILVSHGANPEVDIPLTEYKKEEPETTRKKFDDTASSTSGNISKSREMIVQDNATDEINNPRVQDFLDFDRLMYTDSSSYSPDLRSYDAHLMYTSSQTSGTFTDNSEISLSVPGATPLTPATGSLLESPLDSPFYSPSFRKMTKGEDITLKESSNGTKEEFLDGEEETLDATKRKKNGSEQVDQSSRKSDRRRETWLGVLEKHREEDEETMAVESLEYSRLQNKDLKFRNQENRSVLRGEPRQASSKISKDRRSYNPPLDSINYFNGPELTKRETTANQQPFLALGASQLPYKGFLKSFVVDARGCVAVGGRHSGIRFIVPPGAVMGPTRITCQLIRNEKLPHQLVLSDGEAYVARILKMTSDTPGFLKPVVVEIPHFGVLKSHNRELCLLKSGDGRGWTEHQEEMRQEDFKCCPNDLEPGDKIFESLVHCVALRNLPSYVALVSRIKKDSKNIGNEGSSITSSVCPQVKVTFPKGAINKTTNVGLQVLRVDKDVNSRSPNNVTNEIGEISWSPVVSIEPRCRKFHRPVTVSIPLPVTGSPSSPQNFRLLYNLGTKDSSNWIDITDSTTMEVSNGKATFETGVSARFCVVEAQHKEECLQKLPYLMENILQVPLLARFAVFGKRRSKQTDQVKLRIFCMTEPRERQTLEEMQNFQELAKGPVVELNEGDPVSISLSENLEVTKEDEYELRSSSSPKVLAPFITCESTYNTRVPILVKTETSKFPVDGHVRFGCGSEKIENGPNEKTTKDKENRTPKRQTSYHDDCILGISIPDLPAKRGIYPLISQVSRVDAQNYYHTKNKINENTGDLRNKSLRLIHISEQLGPDWQQLAHVLGFDYNEIEDIKDTFSTPQEQALVFLQKWISKERESTTLYQDLEKGLKYLGRLDVIIQGLYSERDPNDDDNLELKYMDTETNGYINNDDNEDMDGLKSKAGKKSYRHTRSKKSKQEAEVIDDLDKKRFGIVAGVKRHDDFTSNDDSKQGHYEKLIHCDNEDDERYAKLSKFSNGEQRSLDDDDDDGKIDKSRMSEIITRFSESEDSDDASYINKAGKTLDSKSGLDFKFKDFKPEEEKDKYDDHHVNEKLQILDREPDVTFLDKNKSKFQDDVENNFREPSKLIVDEFQDVPNDEIRIDDSYSRKQAVALSDKHLNEALTENMEEEPLDYDARKRSDEFYELSIPAVYFEKVPQSVASILTGGQDYILDEVKVKKEKPDIFEGDEYKARDPTYFDCERQEASIVIQRSSNETPTEIEKRDPLQYMDRVNDAFQEVSIPEFKEEDYQLNLNKSVSRDVEIPENEDFVRDLHVRQSPVYDKMELEDEKVKVDDIISYHDFKNSTEERRANVTEYENKSMQPSQEAISCRFERCQQPKSVYIESTSFDEPRLLQTSDIGITQDVPAVVVDETQGKRNMDNESCEFEARDVDVKFGSSYAREESDKWEDNTNQRVAQDHTESDEGIDTVDQEFQLRKDQYERLSDDLENLESEDDICCEDKMQSQTLETTRVDDKVDVNPLSSECRHFSEEGYQAQAPESVMKIEEKLIIPEYKTKAKETESFPMGAYGEYREDEERFRPNDDNESEDEGNIQQKHKASTADQCQKSKSVCLDTTSFEELQLLPNIETIGYHEAPTVEITVNPSSKLEEYDQGEKPDDQRFGGRNKFFGSADTESSDSDIELDENSRRQDYTGNVTTLQDEVVRCEEDCRRSPPYDVLLQDGRANTISPDSDGDFRDLKEEYSQKYFQVSINPEEIEISGDPVDKLLYCYNSSKICGNSVFYDYDSNNAEEDSSISFMPDFDIYEPSIDHHEAKASQKVDQNRNQQKTIEFKFLDDNSRMSAFKTLFSEDDPRSIDFDSFELGLPEAFRASIEDLPDGYVVSRQSTLEIRRGNFGEDTDETHSHEGRSARHSGSSNVFEQIPGTDGKRNPEEDY